MSTPPRRRWRLQFSLLRLLIVMVLLAIMIGSLSGLLLGVGVAIAQFWPEWTPIVTVLGIFMVGQFVEGYILAPKFVATPALTTARS